MDNTLAKNAKEMASNQSASGHTEQSVVPDKKKGIWLIGGTLDNLTGCYLPSNRQVLGRYFQLHSNEKLTIQASATTTATEVMHLWETVRIPTQRKSHVINKIKVLHEKWRSLRKNVSRMTETQRNREQLYVDMLDDLFDVAHADAMTLVKSNDERRFLEAQRVKGSRSNMVSANKKIPKRRKSNFSSVKNKAQKDKRSSGSMEPVNRKIPKQEKSICRSVNNKAQRDKGSCGSMGPVNRKIPKQEKAIRRSVNDEAQRNKGSSGSMGSVNRKIPKQKKGICRSVNDETKRDKERFGYLGSSNVTKIIKQEMGICSDVKDEGQTEEGKYGDMGSVNTNLPEQEAYICPSADSEQSDVAENKHGIWLIGETLNEITDCDLPSNRQVLARYFQLHSNEKFTIQASATTTATEVMHLWEKARIPTQRKSHVINKIKVLHEKWRSLRKNVSRMTETQRNREQLYVDMLDDLFDVAQADPFTLIKTNEEMEFLEAQQEEEGHGDMGTVNEMLAEDEESIYSGTNNEGIYNA